MRWKSLFEKKSPWSEQADSSLIVLVLSLPLLFQVTYVPLSVLITTFKKENVKRPLEGFGVLVPSVEQQNGLKTLGNTRLFVLYRCKSGTLWSVCQLRFAGTLFSSMMFPDRAPSDLYLYTTFVGGSRNKELASASTWGSFNAPFFFSFPHFICYSLFWSFSCWFYRLIETNWSRLSPLTFDSCWEQKESQRS